MKKLLFFFVLASISGLKTNAQYFIHHYAGNVYYNHSNGYHYQPYAPDDIKQAGLVKTIYRKTDLKSKKNQNATIKGQFLFNDDGLLTEQIVYGNRSGIDRKTNNKFENKQLVHTITEYNNGKKTREAFYERNDDGKIIYQKNLKNGKPKYEENTKYDNNKIVKREYLRKGKHYQTYAYHYYENGELKATNLYNKKGKLEMTWSYECSDEGEKIDRKNRDTVNYCEIKEYDKSGNIVEVTLRTDEDGKIRKYVKTMSPDSVLLERKSFNHNEKLIHHTIFDTNNFGSSVSKSFSSKSGKMTSLREYIRNENNQIIKYSSTYYSRSGKTKRTTLSNTTYNEFGFILSSKRTKNDKPQSLFMYEYTYQ